MTIVCCSLVVDFIVETFTIAILWFMVEKRGTEKSGLEIWRESENSFS